jgi:hypothetical protein
MAVPTSYLTGTKNLKGILEAIQKAGVPQRFTYDWLKTLGYPSSNDRPIIPLFKAMRFIDDSGGPLDRYKRYRDTTQAKAVLAEGMRDAYRDVFAVDQQAQNLTAEQLKGIFARLSGKSDRVADQMAVTFKALASHADFTAPAEADDESPEDESETDEGKEADEAAERDLERLKLEQKLGGLTLHHDIHVHLPTSTQIEVYDAIFRALRQNFG